MGKGWEAYGRRAHTNTTGTWPHVPGHLHSLPTHLRIRPPTPGEASAIYARAEATARGLGLLADAVKQTGGAEAVSLRVAEQYLDSFGEIAKRGTTMLLPAATHDPAAVRAAGKLSAGCLTRGWLSDGQLCTATCCRRWSPAR